MRWRTTFLKSLATAYLGMSTKSFHSVPAMIGPSLLACDLSDLAGESKRVVDAGADFLHLDVMDGHFVPNLTFGAPVIKCLRKHSNAVFDVHLMVSDPAKWVDDMADAGANIFTFHIEVDGDVNEKIALINKIKEKGMKVGIAIKPKTPVEALFPFVDKVDLLLVMTVEPGFGGQKFMSDMMPKVKILRQMAPNIHVEVDGGLGPDTIDEAAMNGANMIVAGSSVFKGIPSDTISLLKRSVEMHGHGKV